MTDLLELALLRGSLDHCVKCTICETQCPVSNVTPLFPGPKYAGPQSERYRVTDEPSVDLSVDYCSGCGICSQVCPQGVKIAEINAQARNKLKRQKGWPLRDRIITRPTWLGRAGTPVAPLANLSLKLKPARILIEKTIGIHRDAAMPAFAGRRFSSWAHKRSDALQSARKIVYFHGCGTEYYEPWEGEKLVAILEHNGFEVDRPQAGLLRPAAAVERAVRRCSQGAADARQGAEPVSDRRRHDHRRQRDELHADAQARGTRGARARGRPRAQARLRATSMTSASCCWSCMTAAS